MNISSTLQLIDPDIDPVLRVFGQPAVAAARLAALTAVFFSGLLMARTVST